MRSWLCIQLRCREFVLDLGTVKRPLVPCFAGCACVSEQGASCLNRQLCAFNMSIPLTRHVVMQSLSSIEPGEIDMLLMLALRVHLRASRAALGQL